MRKKLLSKLMLLLTMLFVGVGSASAADRWVETSPENLVTGDIVAIVDQNSSYAISNNGSTQRGSVTVAAVELSSDKSEMTSLPSNVQDWVVQKFGTESFTYKFKANGTENYLYTISDNNGMRVGSGSNETFSIQADFLYNTGEKRYVGVYNNQDWRSYTSINNNIKNTKVAFYKKVTSGDDPQPTNAVATPTFSPEAGTVDAGTQVTISSETEGAIIYYTTDGTDPTTQSTQYTEAITINETTTIKAIAVKDGMTDSGVATAEYTVLAIQDGVFDFVSDQFDYGSGVTTTTDGNTYIEEEKTWTAGNVTMVTAGKYRWWWNNNDGGTLRFYGNTTSTMTISVPSGYIITKIVVTGGLAWSSADGNYSSGTWNGTAQSVTLSYAATSGSVNVKTVTVTYEQSSKPSTPTFSVASGEYGEAQDVEILCETEGVSIYYTLDGTDPTPNSAPYTSAITISEIATTTLKAIAVKNGESSAVATATYTILDPNRSGTANNPYTVAQAIAAIDAGTGVTGVYATGIVSKIVTAYDATYGNISYNISADGSENSDQLQAFRGKGLNGENFTSEDDIKVGDVVVIYGNLTKYKNTTYEFEAGNYLISKVHSVAAPSISGIESFVVNTTVTITASEGATIYYTLDGTEPTANSTEYTEAFTLTATTTVKVIAVSDGATSSVAEQTFTKIEATNGVFELVTDPSTLAAGDEILIAYVNGTTAKALGTTQNTNNRSAVSVELFDGQLIPGDDAQIVTLEKETVNDVDYFYFNVGDGYLYAAATGNNYMRTEAESDDNAKATIEITEGNATITFQGEYTNNLLRYNSNNDIFSCYASNSSIQTQPQIYRKVVEETLEGDLNDDGKVDADDVAVMVDQILGGGSNYTLSDVTKLVNTIVNANANSGSEN